MGLQWRGAEHELDVRYIEIAPRLEKRVQPSGHHDAGAGAEEIRAQHAHRHAVEAHLAVKIAAAPAATT